MNAAAQQVMRALGDPTRCAVFERLMKGEAAVNALTERFHVSQPAISQHLGVLREAGLVAVRQEGRHRYYRASPQGLAPLVSWLGHHQAFWREKLAKLSTTLEEIE